MKQGFFCGLTACLILASGHFDVISSAVVLPHPVKVILTNPALEDNNGNGLKKKRDVWDDIYSMIFDSEEDIYNDGDSDSEKYLICRNCTVVVNQQNGQTPVVTVPALQPAMPNGVKPAQPPIMMTLAPPTTTATASPTMAPANNGAAQLPMAAPAAAPVMTVPNQSSMAAVAPAVPEIALAAEPAQAAENPAAPGSAPVQSDSGR